jgi:hypothetical protein
VRLCTCCGNYCTSSLQPPSPSRGLAARLVLPPLRGGRAAPAPTPLGGWSSERPRGGGRWGVWSLLLRRGWSWTRSCLARLGNDGGMRTTEMTRIAKGAQ